MGTEGYILLALSVLCMIGCAGSILFEYFKKPLYMRPFRNKKVPENFYKNLLAEYEKIEDIPKTLKQMEKVYKTGNISRRIKASNNYLKKSRYKDFETALYHYLNDDSVDSKVITKIITKESLKNQRLPLKL